jgi:hypothetical protein
LSHDNYFNEHADRERYAPIGDGRRAVSCAAHHGACGPTTRVP